MSFNKLIDFTSPIRTLPITLHSPFVTGDNYWLSQVPIELLSDEFIHQFVSEVCPKCSHLKLDRKCILLSRSIQKFVQHFCCFGTFDIIKLNRELILMGLFSRSRCLLVGAEGVKLWYVNKFFFLSFKWLMCGSFYSKHLKLAIVYCKQIKF